MIKIAVLGYGVVGSGVVEVIKLNANSIKERAEKEIIVEKILDIRDFENCVDAHLMTKSPDDVFENDEISVVVETIGGTKIAYEFTKRALSAGKTVVTSNKELVATHGPELLKLARENNVYYLFEASVGGGMPIIRPLTNSLSANEIISITGIVNGTTNYIMSQMIDKGISFEDALKQAQENGFAEADPTADIEGHDACRKIAILSSIAFNQFVDAQKIPTKGISGVTLLDTLFAEKIGYVIKLIVKSFIKDNKICAFVEPCMISQKHLLANVNGVYNAVLVEGNALGNTMFYGQGAGKLPTASAVVADVIDAIRHNKVLSRSLWEVSDTDNFIDINELPIKAFIKMSTNKTIDDVLEIIFKNYDRVNLVQIENINEFGFVSEFKSIKYLEDTIMKFNKKNKDLCQVVSWIRVEE